MWGENMNEQILKDFRNDIKTRMPGASPNTLSQIFSRIAYLYKVGREDETRNLFEFDFEKLRTRNILTGGEAKAYQVARDIYETWVAKVEKELISKEDFIKLMGHARKIVKIYQIQNQNSKDERDNRKGKPVKSSNKERSPYKKVPERNQENSHWFNKLKEIRESMK